MRSTQWVVMLSAVLLVGGPISGEEAKKRGSSGSSSSDRGSSAGARQPSQGSGSSARSSGSNRGSSANVDRSSRGSGRVSSDDNRGSRGSGSSGAARSETVSGPESRHPRPGTGTGYRYGGYYGYGGSGYYGGYSPYYYRPSYYGYYGVPYYGVGFGYSSGYGFDDGYYGGYGYSAPYYRSSYSGYYRYRETGSIRMIVDPEKTKVYVDGYYAGTVDDFDGMFQRLYVAPGRHDITLKLEGHRSHRFKVYVTEDSTVKIRHNMERGSGDETLSDLTDGREEQPYRLSQDAEGRDRYSRSYEDRGAGDEASQPAPQRFQEEQQPDLRDAGTLRVEVRPDDASIYVDGQFFGTGRRAGSIPLPPGRHKVEAVRPGFRTVERDVEIRVGKTESLAIDLVRN